jgi:orotate phosphoribosyltransferase
MTLTHGVRSDQQWHERKKDIGAQLIQSFYRDGLLRTWLRDRPEGWELVSGLWSPFYIQARNLPSHPETFSVAVHALMQLLDNERNKGHEISRIIGVAAAGVPLAAGAALGLQLPMGYTRKWAGVRNVVDFEKATHDYLESVVHEWGDHALVETEFSEGDRVVVIDDVVTRFDSKAVAIRQIDAEAERRGFTNVAVDTVAVLMVRDPKAYLAAAELRVSLISVVNLDGDALSALDGIATPRELDVMVRYMENPQDFQSLFVREDLRREAIRFRNGHRA